jgi:hypothetical protein
MTRFSKVVVTSEREKTICVVNLGKAHDYMQAICLKVNLFDEARPAYVCSFGLGSAGWTPVFKAKKRAMKMRESRESLDI